ncbi:MAG: phosphate ABC transporter substrate-binding protein PstS family protein [Streptococcaceae bacterium]|nr:phosphate ABC transporter substrate-binding protein PstS family protein [Streptococcaceae bacterium]
MKKVLLGLTLTGAAVALLAGCAPSGNNSSGSSSNEQVSLLSAGSTALQPLVEQAAAEFNTQNPNITISVSGGGSGQGLSGVVQKSIQIGNSDLFAEEKNINDANLVGNKVAVVGFAPVANKDAGVKNLTKQQLIDIFTGKVTNWKEVGGADLAIQVVNRAEGSGTRFNFEKYGLDGATVIKGAGEQDSSGTAQKIVEQTPGAISYLAFSFLEKSNLQAISIDGVEPTDANVQTNDWKIWSYEHMYTNKAADATKNKAADEFIQFILSDQIQQGLVKKLGYLPISDMKVERDATGAVKNI